MPRSSSINQARIRALPLRLCFRHFPMAAKHPRAPALLQRETSLTRGIIRDLFSTKVDKLTVDSKQLFNEIGEVEPAVEHGQRFVDLREPELAGCEHLAEGLEHRLQLPLLHRPENLRATGAPHVVRREATDQEDDVHARAGSPSSIAPAQPPTPEWGVMLSTARDFIFQSPSYAFFPGASIFLLVFSLNLVGDGLRDALDPKDR